MSVKSLQGRHTTYAARLKFRVKVQNMNAKTNEFQANF